MSGTPPAINVCFVIMHRTENNTTAGIYLDMLELSSQKLTAFNKEKDKKKEFSFKKTVLHPTSVVKYEVP
jgi:coproporphyrinogen III oxidase